MGGEWGGAALLATEHAPRHRRSWFGMFPQLGPSIGFLLATLSFLALSIFLNEAQFKAWGWRLPFIASSLLVIVGLYVRLKLTEMPAFAQALSHKTTHAIPLKPLLQNHLQVIVLGALAMVVCDNLFYTATVFCLSFGTTQLGIERANFLGLLCIAILFMTLATPISAWLSDRFGARPVLLASSACAVLAGFALAPLMSNGSLYAITLFLSLALFLMGASFAPMGAFLPAQFPVTVRYTGAGLAYQLGGILGASLAPYISQRLVDVGGLTWVGAYVSVAAAVSFVAVLLLPKQSLV